MKKMLALLLALTVLSGAVLIGGSAWVAEEKEDLDYTEELLYGSGKAAEGLTVRSLTTVNGHLHWDTRLHLGEAPAWDVDFSFTPQSRWYREPSQSHLVVDIKSNIGMSSSSSIDFWDEQEISFLAQAFQDVADRTANGGERTETLPLADYLDYYAMEGNSWVYEEEGIEFLDSVEWPDAGDFFKIQVTDETVEITIEKDDDGNTYDVSYMIQDAPWVNSSSVYRDGAWYLLYSAMNENDGSEIPSAAAPGLYYLPIIDGENEYGVPQKVIDTANVRMLYPVERGENLYLVDEGSKLLIISGGGSGAQAILLDADTMEELQRFEMPMVFAGEQGWQNRTMAGDSVIALDKRPGEDGAAEEMWLSLWALGEDGRYRQEISCDVTPAMMGNSYWDSYSFDGQRLLMASYVDRWTDPSLDVVVCDGQGLQYAARFHSTQRDNRYGVRCDSDTPLLS